MNTISPLAYIHPNAKLGENNYIGPFCYIDDNVVLGNKNTLYNLSLIQITEPTRR